MEGEGALDTEGSWEISFINAFQHQILRFLGILFGSGRVVAFADTVVDIFEQVNDDLIAVSSLHQD
jgi:hypothetical protein